jgi:hypothetical protein
MAGQQHESLNGKDIETSNIDLNSYELKILHHNVQSMINKLLDISNLLSFDNINVDVVLLKTKDNQLSSVQIDQFRLVSSSNRFSRNGGRSGVVRNFLHNKNGKYLKG